MAFALPSKVPDFTDSQRRLEDSRWRASSSTQAKGGTGVGAAMGEMIGGYMDHKELPMYKDKPYSYAASNKRRRFWRQKKTLGTAVLLFVGLLYWLGLFSDPGKTRQKLTYGGKPSFSWAAKGDSQIVDWSDRRERVKEAFTLSWDAYERFAWGYDEFHPISKAGRQMIPKGMGWIIVDSLDTLMIMNLTSRLSHAREWMSTSLDWNQDHDVNTFETTIRVLGGLLSAHYLSTTYSNMAPLAEDDVGASGEDLYLEKATDLADRLMGAFDSQSGVPFASVNLQNSKGIPSHADDGASSTAEAASVQLEMKYLAKLTGEMNYWEKVEKVIQVIDDNGAEDGLVPIFLYANTGTFRGKNIRLGSRGDSYYEYLIKQYLQTSKQETVYLDMWEQALLGVRKHLIAYSKSSYVTILGERPNGLDGDFSPKMDHLVCFMPGTIALGATGGGTVAQAKAAGLWTGKKDQEMKLARELMQTCWGMYKVTLTGLAPEIAHFNVDNPPVMEKDGVRPLDHLDDSVNAAWRSDYIIKGADSHNLQRPETVESLFYMWRITGDEMYRSWGWDMFKAFVNHTAAPEGIGFTSLANVNEVPPSQRDNMESFWLAETLKYFYLLFSPNDLLPLDQIVLNTEAHIFPRFEMGKLFKTGWKRRPRGADGKPTTDSHLKEGEAKQVRTVRAKGTQ
ncbi:MAG: mannosyl-oligosaccharide alpha-1,2-mannosidase [Piccolia ochrophora]|nr:MAG: mannosyl-oligosaccharide alpha-1,2-mannosidase [Piccolia ochrophora]